MDAFVKAAAEALTPGDPGRPKLSDETRRIRQLEAEKKRLKNELYEMKAISELQGRIIAIRNQERKRHAGRYHKAGNRYRSRPDSRRLDDRK